MAGRKRKPAALKRGKSETKEHLDARQGVEEEIRGKNDLLDNVTSLPNDAQVYYNIIVENYRSVGILSNLDIPLIKEVAYVCARLDAVEGIISDDGVVQPVIDKKTGEIVYYREHSLYNVEQRLLKQFTSLAGQIGMSPSSRAQLAELKMQNQEKQEDPLTKAISGVDSDDDEE